MWSDHVLLTCKVGSDCLRGSAGEYEKPCSLSSPYIIETICPLGNVRADRRIPRVLSRGRCPVHLCFLVSRVARRATTLRIDDVTPIVLEYAPAKIASWAKVRKDKRRRCRSLQRGSESCCKRAQDGVQLCSGIWSGSGSMLCMPEPGSQVTSQLLGMAAGAAAGMTLAYWPMKKRRMRQPEAESSPDF
jgi:hypothetical protein